MGGNFNQFPSRKLFGDDELNAVREVFENSWNEGVDFGYQGKYENILSKQFKEYLGGNGYVDAVSSGTAGIYVALKALGIGKGDEVAVSPITSPGGITPVIEVGATISLIDSRKGTNLADLEQVKRAVTDKTKVILLTHAGGYPVFDLQEIALFAKERSILFIEDCSQAHGAKYLGKKVGTFSDIAVWSTMFSKTLATGGSGGLIYAKNEKLYKLVRAYADRGKDIDNIYDQKDAELLLFPALNFNLDEISCAIGVSILSKLDSILRRRRSSLKRIIDMVSSISGVSVYSPTSYKNTSPFYIPIIVDQDIITTSKKEFALAIQNEGVPLNPHYKEVVADWRWLRKYITGSNETPNANQFRDSTFNLYINEQYSTSNIDYIVAVINKILRLMER